LKRMQVTRNGGSLEGIVGKHVYGNLYGCDPALLGNLRVLRKWVAEAAKVARMNLVAVKGWKFGGEKGGVSVLAIVTESHVAVHTWPYYGYATVDIFTCGDESDPDAAFDLICRYLSPEKVVRHFADRSSMITSFQESYSHAGD
jgi:S-adenosylmethionine decarboxylase